MTAIHTVVQRSVNSNSQSSQVSNALASVAITSSINLIVQSVLQQSYFIAVLAIIFGLVILRYVIYHDTSALGQVSRYCLKTHCSAMAKPEGF